MSSRVLSGLLGAAVAAVATFVAPVAHGQVIPPPTYTTAFTRLNSFSGSGAFFNGFRNSMTVISPAIGQPCSFDAASATSTIPWLPGQSQALTRGDTCSPVHPTLNHALVDATTSGILQGSGFGPWGSGGYGGYQSWTISSGQVNCNPRPGFAAPTRRIVMVYVVALRTANVQLFGTTGIAGIGAPPVAAVFTDAIDVFVEPVGQNFRLWTRNPAGGNPVILSEAGIINNLIQVETQCGGAWFINSRSGANVFMMQATPFSQGGVITVAAGWQVVKGDRPPNNLLRNIFNPGPADLEGAPPLNLPDFSKITGMSGGSGGSSGGGSGGSSGGGSGGSSGGSSGSSSGSGSGSVPPPGI